MANEKHVNIINKGVTYWNKWRVSPEELPDLSEAQLSGAYLRGIDLTDVNLIWANLRGATLIDAVLKGANLSEADLDRADLLRANLIRANLSGAKLRGVDFSKANLYGADLSGADLGGANLSEANLCESDLTEATFDGTRLYGVNLSGANLYEADFRKAYIARAVFANNDLTVVKGLDTVTHVGPSTIGIDTISLSKGLIPEVFLRGAGVSENVITFIPSLIEQAIQFYSCFISYSHADQSFARRLHDSLQGRGIRCWLDEHQLLPGQKIFTEIDRGIRLWDKTLLCCSKDSLTSWWVDNEIEIAFDKERRLWKERGKEVLALIPLNLDQYMFSQEWKSGKATQIKARMAADFTLWEKDYRKFDEQFERLVKALLINDAGAETPPKPKL